MKSTLRGIAMAGAGMFLGAGTLWAHPGHFTEGGIWHTVTHTVSSPYHVAVICAVVVLAAGWALSLLPVRAARRGRGEASLDPR
jgi:hypothetical protein